MQVTDFRALCIGPKKIITAGVVTAKPKRWLTLIALEDSPLTAITLHHQLAATANFILLSGHVLLGVETASVTSGRVFVSYGT